MDAIFGGQTSGQASSNNTNAINAAAGNEQTATNNALQWLSQWLGQNQSPVSKFGNIAPPPQYGSGQTIGGGGTNSLGALTGQPAVGNTATPAPPNINPQPGRVPLPVDPHRAPPTTQSQPPGLGGRIGVPRVGLPIQRLY